MHDGRQDGRVGVCRGLVHRPRHRQVVEREDGRHERVAGADGDRLGGPARDRADTGVRPYVAKVDVFDAGRRRHAVGRRGVPSAPRNRNRASVVRAFCCRGGVQNDEYEAESATTSFDAGAGMAVNGIVQGR